MNTHKVAIIHVVLIVILIVIGLFLFLDTYRIQEQKEKVEFIPEIKEGGAISRNIRTRPSHITKFMHEMAVRQMAEALDDMTADEAYDWFQNILEKDIQGWKNPSNSSLDDSVNRSSLLHEELSRLASLDYISIDDMMRRAEDLDYMKRELVVRSDGSIHSRGKFTEASDLHTYLAELDMSLFDVEAKKQITDFNSKLGVLLEKMDNAQEIQEEDCQLALVLLREFNESLKNVLLKQHWGTDYVVLGEMTSQSIPVPVLYFEKKSSRIELNYSSFVGTLAGHKWLYPLKKPEQEQERRNEP